MSTSFETIVLCGGRSSEREVSLRSGRAVAGALTGARLVELAEDALPDWLDAARHVVFPVLHGGWGEDGRAQAELAARGIAFAGCDAAANRLCMDKVATKAAMRRAGVPAIPEVAFSGSAKPTAAELVAALGPDIVIKPSDQGSSVGLFVLEGPADVARALAEIPPAGNWMAERRLRGREMSIGLLDGAPMGLVEIVALTGVYDYGPNIPRAPRNIVSPRPSARPPPRPSGPPPPGCSPPAAAGTSPARMSSLSRTETSISSRSTRCPA